MGWPANYSHRGQKNREDAYKDYAVEAIFKTKLLPDQPKFGYHGLPITTDYYIFSFKNRKNKYDTGSFICGVEAAKGWFLLNRQKKDEIPSFNPLSTVGAGAGAGVLTPTGTQAKRPNPDTVRLINCLQMFISLADISLNESGGESAATKRLKLLIKSSHKPLDISDVRAVNTYLAKFFQSPTYQNLGINSYSGMVTHFEQQYGITLKKIAVSDFNAMINATRITAHYTYSHNASF